VFHIVLYEPEIPPNTGNIIRLCANSGCVLHLVKPLGFTVDAKSVRRAGLDYHDLAQVRQHPNLEACLSELKGRGIFAVETGSARKYSEVAFAPGDALVFGPETRGLPASALERIPVENRVTIPMRAANRSLNLSNAVAIVVFEAWRQNGFAASSPKA
jgi:tRNA (cytidine/uridine-2'-O-)-methyltransferase